MSHILRLLVPRVPIAHQARAARIDVVCACCILLGVVAPEQVVSFQEHPFCLAQCKTPKCPFVASLQVHSFQGYPFSRAHFKTSRWPCWVAYRQVKIFQEQKYSSLSTGTSPPSPSTSVWRSHFKIFKFPSFATVLHALYRSRRRIRSVPWSSLKTHWDIDGNMSTHTFCRTVFVP